MFKRAGIEHNVLNAKYHQREAEIVAGAGQPGAVTIATNMAGRGTDIKLGVGVTESKPSHMVDPATMKEVDLIEDGGLHIIGSERHESRRIDRQLRGRAGRQGDPGASQFFLSLEDDLMRLFGTDRIAKLMDTLGAEEGEVLTHPLITRSIEQAQKRVELQNFQARKRLLDYDDVMNQQREVIYNLRAFALEGGEELKGEALKMLDAAINKRIETALSTVDPADWDLELLSTDLVMHYLITVDSFTKEGAKPVSVEEAKAAGLEQARAAFERKLAGLGEFGGRLLALVMLNVIDEKWKDHLYDLDQLRSAIHYRSWGQKDPLVEYKQEAYSMFVDLMNDVQHTFTERFLKVQVVFDQPPPPPSMSMNQSAPVTKRFNAMGIVETGPAEEPSNNGGVSEADDALQEPRAVPRAQPTVIGAGGRPRSLDAMASGGSGGIPPGTDLSKIGRNDPCPCGSGKKFKKCHG
jgi:preprotein translocase subunit SecA